MTNAMRKRGRGIEAGVAVGIAIVVGCSSGASPSRDGAVADADGTCGNGFLDPVEACDDGNLSGNDGCSPTCTTEASDLTVTIEQASTQVDPTSGSPIVFAVAFSQPVTDFSGGDVSLAGSSAPGTLVASVSGSGTTYVVEVTGMSGAGLVVASIPASVAINAGGLGNAASTSTDNVVTFAP